MKLDTIISKSNYLLKKYSPEILSGIGIVGVFLTAKLASDAGKKIGAMEADRENVTEYNLFYDDPAKYGRINKLAIYTPAIFSGLATAWCIAGSTYLSNRNQAALVAAYVSLKQKMKELSKDYKEKHETDYNSIKFRGFTGETVESDDADAIWFYESYSDRWFHKTMVEVINAEYALNRGMAIRGYVTLSDFYEFLNLETTIDGDVVGWSQYNDDGYAWIDFYHTYWESDVDEDTPAYYTIDFPYEPSIDYLS